MPMVAAVRLDPAAVQIDRIEVAPAGAGMRGLEEDAAVAQDVGGQVIAGRVRQPDGVAAADQRRLQLEARGGPAGINDPFPGGIKRRDGILAESGDPPRRSAGDGDFPDLPRIAGPLFPGEEHAAAVERDRRVRGCGESRRQGPLLPRTEDLNRRAAREAIGASCFVMSCLGEEERRRRRGLACRGQP